MFLEIVLKDRLEGVLKYSKYGLNDLSVFRNLILKTPFYAVK